MRICWLGLVGTVTLAGSLRAQPAFEAASVKLDKGPFIPGVTGQSRGGPGTSDPGRITITQTNLKFILTRAYGVMTDQIYGPAWLDDFPGENFTITATMPPTTSKEEFRLMLQNLLTERFRIALHHETRNFPGYDLVAAQGGPKLNKWIPGSKSDDVAAGPHGLDERGFPVLPPGKPGRTVTFPGNRPGMFRSMHRQSMPEFVQELGWSLNMTNAVSVLSVAPRVIDRTGLSDVYEFRLEFEGRAVMPEAVEREWANEGGVAPVASDPGSGGPTLFTALEKQLGLKLVKAKSVPVDVLVIDHIEKVPLEN